MSIFSTGSAAERRGVRRRFSRGVGLTLASCCALGVSSAEVHGDTVAPSSPVNAVVSPAGGSDSTVSGDGRFVAFVAPPSQPVAGVTEGVWLRDQATGALTELTKGGAGIRPGNSHHPVLSGDGCTIVIETELGLDLFHDDDSARRWDVYRKILPGCQGAFKADEWELISSAATGDPQAVDTVDPSQRPAVDQTGGVIAYARSTAGADGKLNGRTAIDVVDTTIALGVEGRVTYAPGLPKDDPTSALTYAGQSQPALSADGEFLAYTSDATFTVAPTGEQAPTIGDVVAVWPAGAEASGPATSQVFRWDRNPSSDRDATFPLRLVSANPQGAGGSASSTDPTISGNGRFVAYVSSALDIVTPVDGTTPIALPPTTPAQIYRTDLSPPAADPTKPDDPTAWSTVIVSRKDDTVGALASSAPSIDSSGQLVAFLSTATNLTSIASTAQVVGGADVLEGDVSTGVVRRLSNHLDGSPATAAASAVHLSHTGRVAAIDTMAAGELIADPKTVGPGSQVAVVVSNPVLSITPLDLGTNLVGTPTKTWVTTVTNRGTSSFVPWTVSLSIPSFHRTGGTCIETVPVPPGGSCTVELIFTPSATGTSNASLDLKEAGFAATSVSTFVSASGGVPSISASPTTNQLGSAVVGRQGASTVITVGNLGTLASTIARIDVRGSNPGDFHVDTKKCLKKVLDVGATCTLNVSFKPTGNGERNALVLVTATDTAMTSIVLSANGRYEPVLFVPATSVESGQSLTVGGTGFPARRVVTLGLDTGRSTRSVTTDANGAFLTSFEFTADDLPGLTHITAVDTAGAFPALVSSGVVVEEDNNSLPVTLIGAGG
jgi:hypothetical protein